MACEAEKRAFKEAQQRVKALRQTLKDYTGSDKPGGGVPSGNWPEGTHGSNEDLQQVHEDLQNALEVQSNARIALARCTGQPVDYE